MIAKLSSELLMMIIYVAVVSSASVRVGQYMRPQEALETDVDHIIRETEIRQMQKSWENFQAANKQRGKYVPSNDAQYIHVPDNRELGKYIHIPFPYNGGYGPYSGLNGIPYEYDPAGEYSFDKYHTVSNSFDPFNTNVYVIPKPAVYLMYGFPEFTPQNLGNCLTEKATVSTSDTISPSTSVLSSQPLSSTWKKSAAAVPSYESLLSPLASNPTLSTTTPTKPTTTTTPRPKRTYDDEGKWKIIRQDEKKQEKKYQYLYETENGIFAEEHASVGEKHSTNAGTSGTGYYQYIGDDDRIYRVEYTVGEQGYVPKLIILENPLSNRTHAKSKAVHKSSTVSPLKRVSATQLRRSTTKSPPNTINTNMLISTTPAVPETTSLLNELKTTMWPLDTNDTPMLTSTSTTLETLIPFETEPQTLAAELSTIGPLELMTTLEFEELSNQELSAIPQMAADKFDENVLDNVTFLPNYVENITIL